MSELFSTAMWLAAQKTEFTAIAVYGTPLSRPIRNGVGAVALMSIAPAFIASRPSLPSANRRASTSRPSFLKYPSRSAMTSAAPMIEVWTPRRIFNGFWASRSALPRTRAPRMASASAFFIVGGL